MIKNYLADLIGEAFECGDGSEALTAYRKHQPDLVLMDLKMTKMDGLDATRQIRESFPQARIVIVSQWDDAPMRKAARSAGAEAYVGKSDLLPLRRILAGT
jgi:two-component system NarL family response regulator